MTKRITQKDVAALAGVSQAVVSVVLTKGNHTYPQETVSRVEQAANQLGYIPNRFAQALKTNKTMSIACIVPDIANPFYASLVRGVQSVTDRYHYDAIVASTDGLRERELHFLRWSAQGRVDAVVGTFFNVGMKDFAPYLQAGIPIARIEAKMKKSGPLPLHNVYIDNAAAARSAVEYLLAQGHQNITMIASAGGPEPARVEGYRQAMTQAGRLPRIKILPGFNEQSGYQIAMQLINDGTLPDAIFAANDLMAIGVMRAAREKGITIPEQLAVMGFDDIPAAGLVTPSLTTIAQYPEQLGQKAAALLLAQTDITAQLQGSTTEMPWGLVKRESA
ncbi:LacI family DNA-binding transcriptional regulator [Citrobacter sp. Cb014]|uniref:LacI family DNA-binding transcriptional regulator n=1 Tax=Citrobacter sp. Cb014 TaxID=2985014 RepID=UPI00257BAE64|nr:LacI family DNA-binding transcriptional regulator [Citrobacter sp. Cb014]MDM3393983.1 LacI family transcriptional regulator [Citrobacter sp. Cb014]